MFSFLVHTERKKAGSCEHCLGNAQAQRHKFFAFCFLQEVVSGAVGSGSARISGESLDEIEILIANILAWKRLGKNCTGWL
jgi:hypothetical protein